MLIESRLEGTVLYIDAEASGGLDKGMLEGDFQPERVVENIIGVIGTISRKMSEAAAQASVAMLAPSRVELRFAVRVDSNSVVSVSRDATEGQFHVMVEWMPGR